MNEDFHIYVKGPEDTRDLAMTAANLPAASEWAEEILGRISEDYSVEIWASDADLSEDAPLSTLTHKKAQDAL